MVDAASPPRAYAAASGGKESAAGSAHSKTACARSAPRGVTGRAHRRRYRVSGREGRASARPRICRQADACPSGGSSGSTGRHGSTGFEDEDEDEDERVLYRELAPRRWLGWFGTGASECERKGRNAGALRLCYVALAK